MTTAALRHGTGFCSAGMGYIHTVPSRSRVVPKRRSFQCSSLLISTVFIPGSTANIGQPFHAFQPFHCEYIQTAAHLSKPANKNSKLCRAVTPRSVPIIGTMAADRMLRTPPAQSGPQSEALSGSKSMVQKKAKTTYSPPSLSDARYTRCIGVPLGGPSQAFHSVVRRVEGIRSAQHTDVHLQSFVRVVTSL